MDMQQRILTFVTRTNWILFVTAVTVAFSFFTFKTGLGVFAGGIIVTANFHLLYNTLKKSLSPTELTSHHIVIFKYYIRLAVSGLALFILVSNNFVNPMGLFAGLSIVVASIFLATANEFKKLIFKEAV